MPRRREITRREVIPDPKYKDQVVAKFINIVMKKGKKSVAERIVYGAFSQLDSKNEKAERVLEIFNGALDNVRPKVEVKSRRVGGATYQVPIEVRPIRQTTLAMRWLIEAARKRHEKTMVLRLAQEIVSAFENRGAAVKRREDTMKMAAANKAFSHYRW